MPPILPEPAGANATGVRGAPAANLELVASLVDARVRALLGAEGERWAALDPELAAPIERLRDMVLAGGKRLRPAFVHWGHVGAGGAPDDPAATDAGAAFELLHTFALVHDDVVDDSDVRRGRPAMHQRFAERHRAEGFRGESRRFGEGVAVLVGDLAHVYADVLANGLPPEAALVWNELRIELNIGQYLDLLGTARGATDAATAARIARYKSAKYTIERPLHLGAAIAGRLDALAAPYTAYGIPLGEAFQLRDDLLGVFGDERVTGKPVGDDLREGKPTPLLARAVMAARPEQRVLLALVGSPDLEADDIARVQQILVDTGAVATVEASIAESRDRAIDRISDAPIDPDARAALVELAWYVTARDR